jgi:transcriptional regulator with XRE-family HTH domain
MATLRTPRLMHTRRMADNQLGTFLRERREAVAPERVGLPRGERRRTPGLRRAELATLSGVSVDYLTRLEQGRDHHPSASVLAALADALLLAADERELLMRVGTLASAGAHCPRSPEPAREVRPTVRALLDSMEPTAAVVVNRLGDVLASTDGWVRLVEPIGILDDDRPNLVRHLFTDPRARSAFVPWEGAAAELVAELMADNRRDDPHLIALTDEVASLGGDDLIRRLGDTPSTPLRSGVIRLVHPTGVELRLASESLELSDAGPRLLAYLPSDQATADALDELRRNGSGRLRAVPG